MPVPSTRRLAILAVLAGAVVFGASRPADAAFSITLSQAGFNPVTIPDNGSVVVDGVTYADNNLLANNISFTGDYGTFVDPSGGLTLGVTTNSIGSLNPLTGALVRDVTAVARNSSPGSATFTLFVSSDGFVRPAGSSLALRSSLSSDFLIGGDLTSGDTAGATFVSRLISGVTTVSPTLQLTTNSNPSNPTNPGAVANMTTALRLQPTFTLTNQLSITLGGDGSANFTGTTQALVPEPTTMAMALTALPLLGLVYRKRRQASA